MKHTYCLTQQFIISFLLISAVLQSCGTPPNSPPPAKKAELTMPIPIGELIDQQLASNEENIDSISQVQTVGIEQEASQSIQASLDSTVAQGLGQSQASQAGVQQIAFSTYRMARLYGQGRDIEADLELALALYTKASNLDHAKAAYHAGCIHLFSQASGSDVKQAYGFIEKAAKAGIYKACLLLGRMYEYGWGSIAANPGKSLQWYAQASLSLNKDSYIRGNALYHLGWLYKLGKGVKSNEATALTFFEQAAIIGQGRAQDQTASQATEVDKQHIKAIKKEAQEYLIQVLKEIAPNGETIVQGLENTDLIVVGDKADLALLVQHPLFKTNCRSVHLLNQIGDIGLIVEFTKHLQGTNVHTVNLKETETEDIGAIAFAQALQGTNVHTVNLGENEISATGAVEFAQTLQGTNVHTVNLGWNKIGDAGAAKFAQALQGTNVHTVYLGNNGIAAIGAVEFAQNLQGTKVHTVDLKHNQIGEAGAVKFAQALQGTNVHMVNLTDNGIEDETKNLLKQQYSHINWVFDHT